MCLGHLIKLAWLSACFAFWALSAQAQNFSALARIDSATSAITNAGNDNVLVALQLSQGVPFRVFTLSRPDRLVIDFREVDWTGLDSKTLLQSHKIVGVRFGGYRPGWSRLVAQMGQPMAVADVAMTIAPETEAANLSLLLRPASRAVYDAAAGALFDPRWDLPPDTLDPPRRDKASRRLVVMLDPGHGGIDPGAENRGIKEADLMLLLARELKDTLLRTGDYDVLLTREADVFVSLEDRVRLAHQRGADVFISLHADALAHGV
ncbi:MAG: N-acetylmuramoyl-L-alanine amidase, partial [Rhodobacteraceae bacterium]|nr:N-acetylmuramoyl-L-alanine amidase [Paracoccaceae bacterium]